MTSPNRDEFERCLLALVPDAAGVGWRNDSIPFTYRQDSEGFRYNSEEHAIAWECWQAARAGRVVVAEGTYIHCSADVVDDEGTVTAALQRKVAATAPLDGHRVRVVVEEVEGSAPSYRFTVNRRAASVRSLR